MKFFSSLILLLFVSVNIFSQQKFIEVTVDDTVLVKPDLFVYNIIIENSGNYEREVMRDAKTYEKQRAIIQHTLSKLYDSLKTVFTNAGFYVLPRSLRSSVISSEDDANYTINLVTTTTDSVKMIYDMIRNTEFTEGFLWLSKAKDETTYLNLLYKKIIEKAKEKATTIAALSGQKLGSVYSVSETNDMAQTSGWTAYPPLSQLSASVIPGWHTTIQENSSSMITDSAALKEDNYVIRQGFTLKFIVE
jgi:hypothetical protein